MLKRMLILVAALLLVATTTAAQQPKTTASQQPKPPAERASVPSKAPEPPPQPINIKIEFTITDQTGSGSAYSYQWPCCGINFATTDFFLVAPNGPGYISRTGTAAVECSCAHLDRNVLVETPGPMRDSPKSFSYREVRINVDAHPVLLKDGKISITFGLEYLPKAGSSGGEGSLEPGMSSLNERLGLILESGKPMIVSQAADPVSDRKISVELIATVLK